MRTFVEVGLGALRQGGYGMEFPFERGDHYVGIDLPFAVGAQGHNSKRQPISRPIILDESKFSSREKHRQEQTNLSMLRSLVLRHGILFSAMYADGRALPLADGRAHGVLLSNIIGDPYTPAEDKTALINEGLRVLLQGAPIIIREENSPMVAQDYLADALIDQDSWDVEATEADPDSPQWRLMKRRYNLSAGAVYEIRILGEERLDVLADGSIEGIASPLSRPIIEVESPYL